MARSRTVFYCLECGYEAPKWLGKCPGCGAWNQMTEEVRQPLQTAVLPRTAAKIMPLAAVDETEQTERLTTGSHELDRVLGR